MQELEQILMKRHKEGTYMNCFSEEKCVWKTCTYVVWVNTYFSIITVCQCLLLIFSFLNQVSESLTKAQIPLKLGTPEILCWMRTMQSQAMGPSRAAMVIWYKLHTVVEILILQKRHNCAKKAMFLFSLKCYCIWFRKIRILRQNCRNFQ